MAEIPQWQAQKSRKSWKTVRSLLQRIKTKPEISLGKKRGSKIIEGIRRTSRSDSMASKTDGHASSEKSMVVCSSTADSSVADVSDNKAMPKVQKALVVARKGEYEIRHDFPMPHVGAGEIMVRSHYVGLNPIDWKSVDYNFCLPEFPWVTGREMSGVVVQVGKDVAGFREGDKVWTSTYYKDVRAGCFQEYVVVPCHTVLHIPGTVTFEQAACLGVAALTAAMTLWKWLGIPISSSEIEGVKEQWLLIWGGSTVTGQFATQLAALSNINVITVNSAETKALSERLGASQVVVRDGKSDDELLEEIQTLTGGKINYAIDLVGTKTAALVLEAVSREEPVAFAPLAMMASSQVFPDNVTVHTVEMKQFVLDKTNVVYTKELSRLLEERKLVLPELHLIEGGLDVVQEGLEILKKGNMKGKKLVVRM